MESQPVGDKSLYDTCTCMYVGTTIARLYHTHTQCFRLHLKNACHRRNDAIRVISVTNSYSLVHKIRISKASIFAIPRLYLAQTDCDY